MKARQVVGLLMILALVIIVGYFDKQALDANNQHYCNNVKAGHWPDYNKTFKDECGGEDPPKFRGDLTK